MKSLKNILRLWISLTSIFGFFGAWAMLAQSFKPAFAQAQNLPATAYPTLPALAPIGVYSTPSGPQNVNLQVIVPTPTPYPIQPPIQQPVFIPRVLRTGGS
jgi:hypothetical protein